MSGQLIIVPHKFECKEDFMSWSNAISEDIKEWPVETSGSLSDRGMGVSEAVCWERNKLLNLIEIVQEKPTLILPWKISLEEEEGEAKLETIIINFCRCKAFPRFSPTYMRPTKIDGILFKTAMQSIFAAVQKAHYDAEVALRKAHKDD